MDEARIQALIDTLKAAPDETFDMSFIFAGSNGPDYEKGEVNEAKEAWRKNLKPACGSPACYIGWTLAIKDAETIQQGGEVNLLEVRFAEEAMEYLGIDERAANELFQPWEMDWNRYHAPEGIEDKFYSKEKAIKVLENFKKTGKVDWHEVQ